MLLAGVVALVCGSASMLGPESEFDGKRLTQFRRLVSLPGPPGRWRAAEDSSDTLGQTATLDSSDTLDSPDSSDTLSSKFREKILGGQTTLDVCTENPPSAVMPDYPSVHVGREKARKE